MKNTDKIILGIDPGTVVMGYGIIHINATTVKLISAGVLALDKKDDHFIRIKEIFDTVEKLIQQYKPDEFAIEEPFFGKNVQSMLKLGRAQGAAISAALHHHLPVFGYSPRAIKKSITGNGSSSKEQVASMLRNILKFEETPKFLDATDALGVALCHHFQSKGVVGTTASVSKIKKSNSKKSNSSWSTFINQNPERIKK
ncbi:MAG: crossover junction endodeoxyribonuclease RuvC [Bacteroidota bacterium]